MRGNLSSAGTVTRIATLLAAVLAGCTAPPAPPSGPVTLTVVPEVGPPGTFVSVAGLGADALARDDLALFIGGVQMPATVEEDGTLTSMLPPFVGSTGWHEPTGPVDVVVEGLGAFRTTLGIAESAVTVTALPPAPDAHDRIVTSMTEVVDAFELIALSLPTDTAEDDQIMWAVAQALREFVATGENSLAAIGAGTAPLLSDFEEELGAELGAAILETVGIPQAVEELAARAQALAAAMAPVAPATSAGTEVIALCPNVTGPDEDLACRMQLYVVVKRIGEEVLTPVAKQFAYVTAFTGIAGMAIKVPYVSAVSLSLSLADLAWNRIVVALLPAKIDSFTLTFDDGAIVKHGDRIEGRLELTASNDPPGITSSDLLSLVTGVLPPGAKKLPSDADDYLLHFALKTIDYFLGILAQSFAAYADAHKELNLDFELTAMPSKTWGPTRIEDYDLFDAHSFTPDLLAVDEETPANPAWRATPDVSGDARVQVRTATGEEARRVFWDGYQGGAFGDDHRATETVTVCVDDVPELTAVSSVSPTVILAETNTQVTFTLPWQDHCDNLDTLFATYEIVGGPSADLQHDVESSPKVAGFAGGGGEGVLIETLWVGCSEKGRERLNASFYLLDEFSQASAERTAFLIVDYGGCP